MQIIKKMIRHKSRPLLSFGRRVNACLWQFSHHDYFVIFNWHQVSPVFHLPHHHEDTWTRLKDFEREVEWLASEHKILPLPEALERLKKGSLRGCCAALTFDDGDISMAEHLLPLLKRRGWPATLFFNTAYLDTHASYWFPIANYFQTNEAAGRSGGFTKEMQEAVGKLRRTNDPTFYEHWRRRIEELATMVPDLKSRLVSMEWLSKLDGAQFTIGAHGHEHQRFSMMPPEWQENDLRENIRVLSQFKAFKSIFAIPFGRSWDWSDDTLKAACGQGLDIMLAAGGLNVSSGRFYHRIPGDHQKLRSLITSAMACPSPN